jgi:hypothetical protein
MNNLLPVYDTDIFLVLIYSPFRHIHRYDPYKTEIEINGVTLNWAPKSHFLVYLHQTSSCDIRVMM